MSDAVDYLIQDIDIADGSGKPIFNGNVGIKNGRIAFVQKSGQKSTALTAKKIKKGQKDDLLCPGFIDTHTHGDLQHVLDPYVRTQLLQGVTFSICGNCGISAAPVSKENFQILREYCSSVIPFDTLDEEWKTWTTFQNYLNSIKKRNPVFQSGALVGQGTLRIAVMGMENRKPEKNEIEKMKDLLREAMEAGALGLSSGLVYIPGVYSDSDEMIELCKVVKEYDGFYATHMRSESRHIVEAVKEAIHVAESSGCKLIISHLKVSGLENAAFTDEILKLILEARERGVKVICDQYQSNKGSTTLAQLLPPEYQSEGIEGLLKYIKSSETKKEIIKKMEKDSSYENYLLQLGASEIIIVANQKYPEFDGLTLEEISHRNNISPARNVCNLLLENDGNVLMAITMCRQDIVDRIFKFPFAAVGSDGIGAGGKRKTHPRANGNFVHLFEDYVRNRKLVSWEEGVRKCTSLPADFIGLKNKGHILEGYDADIVIFDRTKIGTDATFAKPNLPPKGIKSVFIKGREVVLDGNLVI
ncbi:MAG: D-aminoacylase [Spirochaetaceae bacterium]|nr:D-aminoacylase [Spirochaetaceae bacterium]